MAYQAALNLLPKRAPSETKRTLTEEEDDLQASSSEPAENEDKDSHAVDDVPEDDAHANPTESEDTAMSEDEKKEVTKLRSMLYANIGACHVKLVRRPISAVLPMLTGSRGSTRRR